MRLRHPRRRAGFTLVELIVAAGLTLLIMAVLATGFQVGLQSLSTLKSAGELSDRIRAAETLLRQDLDAPHFDNGPNPGSLPLSQLRLDLDATVRPLGGFVQIRQPNVSAQEGIDQDGLSSTRAQTHGLSLTVRRSGKTPGDLFAATEPLTGNLAGMNSVAAANPSDVAVAPTVTTVAGTFINTYVTDWAEVHWFLDTTRPTIFPATVNGVSTPVVTFPLCRRARLLTRNQVTGVNPGTPLAEVVSANAAGTTNTLSTIAETWKVGPLTNRLNNTDGTLTFPTGHGITAGQPLFLSWLDPMTSAPQFATVAVGLVAPPVNANDVSFTGATGSPLPPTGTVITAQAPTRMPIAAIPSSSPRFGDDIVITNVVSFEVKPTGVVPSVPGWPRTSLSATALNADFPFDDLPPLAAPNGPLTTFDTAFGGFAGATLPPALGAPPIQPARITGVQIKIRVYDPKNKLTRQSVVTSKL